MTTTDCKTFTGKYRGTVINNVDPLMSGRIQVMIPDVLSFTPSSWAMPALPSAGLQMGMFTVPAIGSGVWIEFEQGDPDYPVWTGGFWGSAAEVPASSMLLPPAVPGMTLQTPGQTTVQVSDLPGPTGVVLRCGASMIIVSQTGIVMTTGAATITMTGPTVTVNNGALVVT